MPPQADGDEIRGRARDAFALRPGEFPEYEMLTAIVAYAIAAQAMNSPEQSSSLEWKTRVDVLNRAADTRCRVAEGASELWLTSSADEKGVIRLAPRPKLDLLTDDQKWALLAREVAYFKTGTSEKFRGRSLARRRFQDSIFATPIQSLESKFGPWTHAVRLEAVKEARRLLILVGHDPKSLTSLYGVENMGLDFYAKDMYAGWTGDTLETLIAVRNSSASAVSL